MNMKRKITPTDTLDWYIKWAGTFMLLAGLVLRASAFMPGLDILFTLNGTIAWFIVGWLWHDRSLLVLNAIAAILLLITLLSETGAVGRAALSL
jgi:hypothetical protein